MKGSGSFYVGAYVPDQEREREEREGEGGEESMVAFSCARQNTGRRQREKRSAGYLGRLYVPLCSDNIALHFRDYAISPEERKIFLRLSAQGTKDTVVALRRSLESFVILFILQNTVEDISVDRYERSIPEVLSGQIEIREVCDNNDNRQGWN